MGQKTAADVVKPPALCRGDTIGIVAPASDIKADLLSAGCAELEAMGFQVRYRDDIYSRHRYTAGGVERRRDEFLEMLRAPDVRAIFAARGGYGSGHLLGAIDPAELRDRPKIFCGASDLTMLLALYARAGVAAFHSPMVATSLRKGDQGYDRALLTDMLVGGEAVRFPLDGCVVLRQGEAEGILTGGCLSLVVSTLGTRWELDTADRILIIEDVDVKPFQIDRMLKHLAQAGKMDDLRGIVFGEMVGCTQHPEQGYRIEDVILDALADYDIPVLFGFPTGHSSRPHAIVPFGVRARLSLGAPPVFELKEAAVDTG